MVIEKPKISARHMERDGIVSVVTRLGMGRKKIERLLLEAGWIWDDASEEWLRRVCVQIIKTPPDQLAF